jgi:hypothetical protein
MKKVLFSLLLLAFGLCAVAQQIQLRSVDKAECVKSDMTGLKASFSFSSLDARNIETTRGNLSEIYIDGTYPNGNVGEPQLPMFTRLIAIPTGATPIVTVGAHSETEYTLSDYGIGTVAAMQAPIHKNLDPNTMEYAFNEAAYARDSYNNDPIAMVEVLGTMRGITLGRLIVQPVRYNPVAGTVKVFNDIEVNVDFQNGDAESTEQMFKSTANVAFQSVYDQIFNIDMLMGGTRDAYTDHPDFYNTPVKMLVICYSGFKNNSSLNSWLQWKLQKGYYVDIFYTDETGTSASNIASFIKTKYNASVSAGNAYTYLIVIGDTGQVPQYMNKNIDSSIGNCASDLGYASVNFSTSTSNYFPDMYYSRISVENTTHLSNYINKVLTYEKFEFTDGGNYLNNVILVGGWDSNWTSRVAKPTINYATNNYFKASNTTYGGYENGTISATVSTSSTQGYSGTNNGCYNGINNGVCFLNYTAHGDKQEWYQPKMTAAQVATLSNTGKYFFGVGNCCLTGNFNNTTTTYSPGSAIGTNACFAETMIRVPNAGAIAYVGCSPYSYWYEDFYWAVGAHSYSAGNAPSVSGSSKGVYDVMFNDQYWNSASALMYLGNLAVQQAVSNGNTNSSITDGNCNNSAHYYFQFYHTFGDGSVMPYITKPEVNTVTIPSTVTPGTTSITVNALAGSYVAVTDNSSVIYGVAEANTSGVATVNFTNAIPGSGTLYVVVTRQQYQPYFGTINVVGNANQAYITATANPAEGGTVSGAGIYELNGNCTLTATPNMGYTFTNWKKGSQVVSTNTAYTFTVTENATYTATFTAIPQYTVTIAPNPVEGGTVAFGGRGNRDDIVYDFEDGWQGWTTFQGNTTSPNSWMHNTSYPTSNNNFSSGYGHNNSDGFMLSESYISGSSSGSGTAVTPDNYLVSPQVRLGGSISFYAGARNTSYCAEKFSVMVSTTDNTNASSFTTIATWTLSLSEAGYNSTPYTVDLSAYSGMGYVAIRHYDCYDQWFLCVDDITIVEGEVYTGIESGTYYQGDVCNVTATANDGYSFVNWTENGTVVSTDASYTFTVTSDRELVANFVEVATQTTSLGQGLTWWTPTVAMTLSDLEQALGNNAVLINSQNAGFARYENGTWSGTLTEIVPGQMYKIETNDAVSLTVSGTPTTSVSLTLMPGYNWFGYTGNQAKAIAAALGDFTPSNGDTITAQDGATATYNNSSWNGTLNTLQPGHGYIYNSTAFNSKQMNPGSNE